MLYNAYRPKKFSDVLGQPAAVILSNLAQGKRPIPHSILLTGTRGIGKTTLARIFARAVNCVGEGVKPCRKCYSCRLRAHPDIIEVDSTIYGSADSIHSLVHSMQLSPDYNRRVYILDEAHTLSSKAMSILLKSVEEPRTSSIVFLLTTNEDKIDAALRSRCMWLKLGTLGKKDILRLLARVSLEEGIKITKDALVSVADHSQGSARDALSILETFVGYGREVTKNDIDDISGERVDTNVLIESMIGGNVTKALDEINRLCTFHATKPIMDSCISGMVKKMRDNIENGISPEWPLRWANSLKQSRAELANSHVAQLPLEVSVAQVIFSQTGGDKISMVMGDWAGVINFAFEQSENLGKLLSRLKPVRIKAGKGLICKAVDGGYFKDPNKVAILASKMATSYARSSTPITIEVI